MREYDETYRSLKRADYHVLENYKALEFKTERKLSLTLCFKFPDLQMSDRYDENVVLANKASRAQPAKSAM